MNIEQGDQRDLVSETRRRLRLSRPVSGLTRSQATVIQAVAGADFDVLIVLTPPDDKLAVKIGALFPDIRVRVKGAEARRCVTPADRQEPHHPQQIRRSLTGPQG